MLSNEVFAHRGIFRKPRVSPIEKSDFRKADIGDRLIHVGYDLFTMVYPLYYDLSGNILPFLDDFLPHYHYVVSSQTRKVKYEVGLLSHAHYGWLLVDVPRDWPCSCLCQRLATTPPPPPDTTAAAAEVKTTLMT